MQDMSWFNISYAHKVQLGKNWLVMFLILQVIALIIALLASFLAPLNTLESAVRVNGLVYRVGDNHSPYCFNLLFLNFGR